MPKPEENSLNLGPHQFIPSLLGNLLPPRPESSDPSLSYLSLLGLEAACTVSQPLHFGETRSLLPRGL